MSDWNTKIIEEFRTNDGRVGGPFEGATLLLLHHTGAKTGTERVNPLMYRDVGDGRMAIFASKGGAPDNPDWFHNLKANPDARVEVGTETKRVRARVADEVERNEIWEQQVVDRPQFAEYQAKTDRTIPVVILEQA